MAKAGKQKPISRDEADLNELDDATGRAVPSNEKEISGTQLETYIEDIADTVRVGLDQSISILTPWFFNNMPKIYYQTTPRQEKVRHLSAIITGHVFETKQTVELWDRDRSKVTYIGPGGDRVILWDMARRLRPHSLKMGGLYFSRDSLLFLSTFFCTDHKDLDLVNKRIVEKITYARQSMLEEFPEEEDLIDHYIKHLDNDFVMYATASRLSITFRMVYHMLHHQGAHTFLEPFENSSAGRLTLGLKNVNPGEMLEAVLHLIHRYDFNVGRAFIARFDKGYNESITVMHFIVSHASGMKVSADLVPVIRLTKALRTLGWVDSDEYGELTYPPFDMSINASNLIRGIAKWCHLFLSKDNPHAYSQYKIRTTFFKYPEITLALVSLFRTKFDPLREDDRGGDRYEKDRLDYDQKVSEVIEEIDAHIFRESVRFVDHVLKTNYFLPTKTGLAFRLDPAVLNEEHYPNRPFGIFYVIGRGFRMFQVRWKDISRGGLRVVMPRNAADYDYALSGLFDEVYGLSYAQQLKNKDIPEGGSKAVLILRPEGHRDQAVKGAVNALLDLLVEEDESHESVRARSPEYYKAEEIIYLGPDENMTNELIEWIPSQAKRRGYRYAAAFMSSKPGEGINHKEYGVTSQGVHVYVDNILRFMGIDPRRETFSVKFTGGPDGDVAGNELKILHRDYGENARVVSISDGFGCAYDPDGLNWDELLRLFHEEKSIVHFDRNKLGSSDKAMLIEADTRANIKIRNEICARVYADIFIPAGGRPYSFHDKNWNLFIDEEGKPTQRAIIEGANIFFTPGARDKLQKAGVYIVKDSSANKTGVICSSYEIIASLTLSKEEFLEIKETYVDQVIEILRHRADQEAKLLIRSYMSSGGAKTFVDLSMEISKEINEVTDLLLDHLTAHRDKVLKDPFFNGIILEHCPALLREKYRERIERRLPDAHKIAIIASSIASYVIYKVGLGWLNQISRDQWYHTVKTYMEKDQFAARLLEAVSNSNVEGKEEIKAILARSAARDLTILELENEKLINH